MIALAAAGWVGFACMLGIVVAPQWRRQSRRNVVVSRLERLVALDRLRMGL
jgi:hypothetical protein